MNSLFDSLRGRWIPFLLWLGLVVVVGWMMCFHTPNSGMRAFSSAPNITVASVEMARLVDVPARPGQIVQKGEILAVLDTSALEHELSIVATQIDRDNLQIHMARGGSTEEQIRLQQQLEQGLEASMTELASSEARLNTQRGELQAVESQLAKMARLVKQGLASQDGLGGLTRRKATLTRAVQSGQGLVDLMRRHSTRAYERLDTYAKGGTSSSVAALEHSRQILDYRRDRLIARLKEHTIRSPVEGVVQRVVASAGEIALPGSPLVTLTSAGTLDVSICVPENRPSMLQIGHRVTLHAATGRRRFVGRVRALSPAVAPLPERCSPMPNVEKWGRVAYVKLDVGSAKLLPGEVLSLGQIDDAPKVQSSPNGQQSGGSIPAPSVVDTQKISGPQPLFVPENLLKVSRFEPSAVAWFPPANRYIILSDDTGLSGEDRPWIFTMSKEGDLDDKPREIQGVGKISDLEAIAYSGKGSTLYLLCSQSRSRRGKRPSKRQRFIRVRYENDTFTVTGEILLAKALEEMDSEGRSRILKGSLDTLDIEGMAIRDGALFLGLKSPITKEGAPIWKLAKASEVFDGRRSLAENLSSWRMAKLQLKEEASEPMGIASLEFLPDGDLLIAGTQIADGSAEGAIWLGRLNAEGALGVRRIARTPGFKPEGLSLTPTGLEALVLFDKGDQQPAHMRLDLAASTP